MTLEKYTSYKDSGVEWIGEIPEHWNITKLKYLGTSTIGLTYNPNDLCNKEEGTLVLRSSNIQNGKLTFDDNVYVKSNIPKKLFIKENDILICSRNGSRELIGKCAIAKKEDESYSFGAFTTVFRSKLNSYLFQILNSEIFKKQSGKFLTSTINQLTVGNLNSFEIPLPPKQEQIKIASFLDEKTTQIDEVISQKDKLIELLKERKQIVINEAVTKGLDKTAEFKESGVEWIGKIPKHWEISKLGTCLKPISIKNKADLPLLSVTREQGVILRDIDDKESNHNFIPDDLSGYKMVEKGQFAMNKMKAWQGSYGISDYTGIVSPAYFIFELNGIEPSFFHKAIRSSVYVPFFIKASDGVRIGQWDLSKSRMKEISFYIPPKDEQLQIVEYIETQTTKIDNAIELQQNYIAKLKEYKATLIDSVVTGKVRVAS